MPPCHHIYAITKRITPDFTLVHLQKPYNSYTCILRYFGVRITGVCIFIGVFLGYLLPPTNGSNHDSSIAMQNCKMVPQHRPKIQHFAASGAQYTQCVLFPYPVPLHGTQKHDSFSAGVPAMQVHLHIYHLPSTLCALRESSS